MFFVVFICNMSRLNVFVSIIMTVEKKNKPHANVVDYFKELSFYNKHIEKPKIKCLKNINLLSGLPFL